jgi:hypothetical protein
MMSVMAVMAVMAVMVVMAVMAVTIELKLNPLARSHVGIRME